MANATERKEPGPGVKERATRVLRPYQLIDLIRSYEPTADADAINKAYVFGMQAHSSQTAAAGVPFHDTLMAAASLLAEQKAHSNTIMLALVSAVLEATAIDEESVASLFGLDLYDGLLTLTRLRRVAQAMDNAGAPPLETVRTLLAQQPTETALQVLSAEGAVSLEEADSISDTDRQARIRRFSAMVHFPIASLLRLDVISERMERAIGDRFKVEAEKLDILTNREEVVSQLGKWSEGSWRNIRIAPDYSLLSDNDIVVLSQAEMVSLSKMKDSDYRRILDDAIDILRELPSGELKRIYETAKKKLAKWPQDVPRTAPEFYQDRKASETLPEFLRRVYGGLNLLDGKLTTTHLEVIDPHCASAVRSWINKHGSLPEDIKLPTRSERPKGLKYNR